MDSSSSLVIGVLIVVMLVNYGLLSTEMLILLFFTISPPVILILRVSHRITVISFSPMLTQRSTVINIVAISLFL